MTREWATKFINISILDSGRLSLGSVIAFSVQDEKSIIELKNLTLFADTALAIIYMIMVGNWIWIFPCASRYGSCNFLRCRVLLYQTWREI